MGNILRLSIDTAAVALFAFATYTASGYSSFGRWYPLSIAGFGLAIALLNLGLTTYKIRRRVQIGAVAFDTTLAESDAQSGPVAWLAWIIGYAVSIFLFGVMIGTTAWLIAFFRIAGHQEWRFIAIATPATLLGLVVYRDVMELLWPSGIVFEGFF